MLSLGARIRRTLVAPSERCCFRFMGSLSQTDQVPHSVDEECSHLLQWLRQKARAEISSHLTIGKSIYGRSLFASKPIQAGDCILKIPRSAHLTADNLHPSVSSLLGEFVDDGVKLVLAVLLHQKLGQLQQLAMEATKDDGHLARFPLKNKAREMEAHRFLYLRFDDMIENHTAALESLTRAASPTPSGKCARRMQLARDLLTNDLQILRSASAWLKNYCETLKV